MADEQLNEISNGVRVIGKESAVTIGLALILLGGAAYLTTRLANIEHSIELMSVRLTAMNDKLDRAADDRYRKQDARETFRELQRLNPELDVPDPGNGNMAFRRGSG